MQPAVKRTALSFWKLAVRRSDPDVQAVQRGEGYEWAGPSTWACYRPDADVLVPVFSRYGRDAVRSPFATGRNITALARFDYAVGDGKSLVAHHGHRLRKELVDLWAAHPLPGSELGLASTEVGAPAQLQAWSCPNQLAAPHMTDSSPMERHMTCVSASGAWRPWVHMSGSCRGS